MVVVVPAFSEGKEATDQVVSALVTGLFIAIQYFNLESGCEELFSVINQISEVSLEKRK